jgi:hypothetical protein
MRKSTLMGWTQEQWDQASDEFKKRFKVPPRIRGSILNAMCGERSDVQPYIDLQVWWDTNFSSPPPDRPVVKPVEQSKMSTERVNFGFPCKVITKGWSYDPMTMRKVYEIRVRVGEATFGSRQVVDTRMAEDAFFMNAVEHRTIENLKREVVDKLFPNL